MPLPGRWGWRRKYYRARYTPARLPTKALYVYTHPRLTRWPRWWPGWAVRVMVWHASTVLLLLFGLFVAGVWAVFVWRGWFTF